MARILLVDDDESTRILVRTNLTKAGHRVLDAGSAEEGLQIIAERDPPDVAVLDVRLPGMDGIALAQQLRADSGNADLPIIFLSAGVEDADIQRGRDVGAIYLTKPFVGSALVSAIERSLPGPSDNW